MNKWSHPMHEFQIGFSNKCIQEIFFCRIDMLSVHANPVPLFIYVFSSIIDIIVSFTCISYFCFLFGQQRKQLMEGNLWANGIPQQRAHLEGTIESHLSLRGDVFLKPLHLYYQMMITLLTPLLTRYCIFSTALFRLAQSIFSPIMWFWTRLLHINVEK